MSLFSGNFQAVLYYQTAVRYSMMRIHDTMWFEPFIFQKKLLLKLKKKKKWYRGNYF